MKFTILSLFILNLVGCSSSSMQSEHFLRRNAPGLSEKAKIIDVSYIKQGSDDNGATALAMIMNFKGHEVKVEELTKEMPLDILESTRKNGMIGIQVTSISDLIKELSGGNPVLIFENLGLDWYPNLQYTVAVGYDVTTPSIILHTKNEKFVRVDLNVFERSWKLTNYWGLVLLNPREIPITSTELAYTEAANTLEQVGKRDEASDAYKTILKRWPDSLSALVGLGNVNFAEKDLKESIKYLRLAKKKYPQSETVNNYLKIAQQALK